MPYSSAIVDDMLEAIQFILMAAKAYSVHKTGITQQRLTSAIAAINRVKKELSD